MALAGTSNGSGYSRNHCLVFLVLKEMLLTFKTLRMKFAIGFWKKCLIRLTKFLSVFSLLRDFILNGH